MLHPLSFRQGMRTSFAFNQAFLVDIKDPVVFQDTFILFLSPLPPAGPGEGPDCHCPTEIGGLGPIPARIQRELNLFYNFEF